MPSYKRAVHLFPARVVMLGATVAIVVALVSTAAAAAGSSADTGSQNFRGERDFWATSAVQHGQTDSMAASGNGYPPAPWAPASGPTSAVQHGQTDSMAASGNGYPPAPWAPALWPTEAPQPGQTGW
jgi:hypothetical protein